MISVTGIGVVSPVAVGRRDFWSSLLQGISGVAPIESFDSSRFRVHIGGEVRGFAPEAWIRTVEPSTLGRASQLAVAAARLALEDADLTVEQLDSLRTGVAMGTTSGEPREVECFDDQLLAGTSSQIGPEFLERYPGHRIPANIASELGLGGPNVLLPTACAAGNYAVARGLDLLRTGRVDRMLVGGADAFSRITFSGFARLGAVAPERCAPFDRERQGMIPGEGAAVLVLERTALAAERGARIYAEVAGYGLSCDAHHMTAAHPEGDGPARAMTAALQDSGLNADQVDYISAHGTGTPTNDRLETLAVHRVFGSRSRRVPISSIKSMLGHTMGAASAFEAAVCCLAIHDGRIPPTIN
ncbi:MAG: beta-ketoacyl-[acyl-carrier-protein] synthase family protein, partial [Thermoanaerobaculia bacterium]|nr:beta-ketoacyl-[acyl-carrier-protein] synthase family protein [Thermoanaerobaculia bacterium]